MAQNKITSSQIKDISADQITGVVQITKGGTGSSSISSGYVKSDGSTLTSVTTITGTDISGDITGKASNVTGIVAVVNGGTGQTSFTAGYIKSDGSTLSSISTIAGSDVAGDITGKASNVTGIVAVANGGTGASTEQGARTSLLPSQANKAGQVLSTNGTDVEWVESGSGTVTSIDVSGGTTGITFTGGPITSSGIITMSGTLAIANGGTGVTSISPGYVKSTGTVLSSALTIPGADITGDITGKASNVTGVVAIANGGTGKTSFTSGYLKSDGSSLSSSSTVSGADVTGDISGKSSNVTGVVDIANGGTGGTTPQEARTNILPSQQDNNGYLLSTNGSDVSWVIADFGTVKSVDISGGTTGLEFTGGPITDTGTITMSGTLSVSNGGTGKTSFTSGYLKSDGTNISSSSTVAGADVSGDITGKSSNVTGVVAIANGGTGKSTFTAGYLKYTGTEIQSSSVVSASDISGTVPISNGGTGQVTRQAAINSLVGTHSQGMVLRSSGADVNMSLLQLSTDVAGTLAVTNGGTGQTSFTSGYLKSDGTTLSSSSTVAGADVSGDITGKSSNVTGVVAISNGGTGISSYSIGDLLYASNTNVLSNLAKGTDGQVLSIVNGVPAWGPAPLNVEDLPIASTSQFGVVKIDGSSITIANGIISATATQYTLPVASDTVLGGVKIDGSSIVINQDGVISTLEAAEYDIVFSLPGYVGAGNIFIMAVNRPFILRTGLPLSVAACLTRPISDYSILMNKKSGSTDTNIGSITFTSALNTGSFTFTTDVSFASGDILYFTVDFPDVQISDLSITIAGELT
jgi:hypothetical protein